MFSEMLHAAIGKRKRKKGGEKKIKKEWRDERKGKRSETRDRKTKEKGKETNALHSQRFPLLHYFH